MGRIGTLGQTQLCWNYAPSLTSQMNLGKKILNFHSFYNLICKMRVTTISSLGGSCEAEQVDIMLSAQCNAWYLVRAQEVLPNIVTSVSVTCR